MLNGSSALGYWFRCYNLVVCPTETSASFRQRCVVPILENILWAYLVPGTLWKAIATCKQNSTERPSDITCTYDRKKVTAHFQVWGGESSARYVTPDLSCKRKGRKNDGEGHMVDGIERIKKAKPHSKQSRGGHEGKTRLDQLHLFVYKP